MIPLEQRQYFNEKCSFSYEFLSQIRVDNPVFLGSTDKFVTFLIMKFTRISIIDNARFLLTSERHRVGMSVEVGVM